jgi:hypothetical protein
MEGLRLKREAQECSLGSADMNDRTVARIRESPTENFMGDWGCVPYAEKEILNHIKN